MPFPLAHPAAVLPFRRFCPKYFDFSALVIGSLCPDLAASIDDWEYFSHTFIGSLVFCVPVGILTEWLFRSLRRRCAGTLPDPHRNILLSLCDATPRSAFYRIVSLLLGSWLHLSWDLFTHDHSPLVRKLGILSVRLAGVPVNRVIWVVSSLVGTALVLGAYRALLRTNHAPLWVSSRANRRAYALWGCIVVTPLVGAVPLAIHDPASAFGAESALRVLAMYYLGCAYVSLALIGLLLNRATGDKAG